MPNLSAPSPKADLALTVFLQDVASGRRVLWIGDASTGGAERLASMALEVRVMDTSGRLRAGRVGAARVAPFNAGRLNLDGHFDLVVVPDAGVLEDLNASTGEIKRALGDGLLVLGTHADTEHYERAVPALDAAFREVRLLGQAPFAASAIANLDHDGGNVALDGSLLGDVAENIERYLFVAGDELPENDGLLVVQIPGGDAPAESNEREVKALRQELNRAGARLEQAQVRLVETEATLSEARARLGSRTQAEETSDVSVLEEKLRDRGTLIRSLQNDAGRHAVLVRDIAEELREWTSGRRGAVASEGALDTEASLAAAQFTIDELRAEVLAARASVPLGGSPSDSAGEDVGALHRKVESLEGERNGLVLRLADVEASLSALTTAPSENALPPAPGPEVTLTPDQLDRLDALQAEVEELRRINSELTLNTVDLAAEKDALETRGREASSALAARDALITRLQIDLAQEENTRALHDQQAVRLREEVENLREAVVAASEAVDEKERAEKRLVELQGKLASLEAGAINSGVVELAKQEAEELSDELREVSESRDATVARLGEVEGELGSLREKADATQETVAGLEAFKTKATEALAAARATLSALQDGEQVPERSTITSVGTEAPAPESSAEHDTLMRSLTAQLEERDDRIRALERRVRGDGDGAPTDSLELEERADRLQEALDHERSARSAADERVLQLLKQTSQGPADLEQALSAKETALQESSERVETLSGDVSSLRGVCAETREGLESLLADADADEEAARRIGALLDILRGF